MCFLKGRIGNNFFFQRALVHISHMKWLGYFHCVYVYQACWKKKFFLSFFLSDAHAYDTGWLRGGEGGKLRQNISVEELDELRTPLNLRCTLFFISNSIFEVSAWDFGQILSNFSKIFDFSLIFWYQMKALTERSHLNMFLQVGLAQFRAHFPK